ncbi:hypothetical protein BsWGS_00898 [Bradybaena similaris]
MDDDFEEAPRNWMKKPKDSFQNELQAKLRQRKYQGKSVDISDSDDNDPLDLGGAKRPTDYRQRRRQTSDLSHGLGTQTMRVKDLSRMLKNSLSDDDDDEDDEIIAANFGRSASRESLRSSDLKTPSPNHESKYLRKTAQKNHSENVGVFGRKTPVKETSPHSSLYKEDGMFGRRTPTTASREERSITFHENEYEDKQWQPPKYRNVSPKDGEQSRGSRRVSPIDSNLDRISESIEEKVTKRGQHEGTGALSHQNDKPKPQVRGKVGYRKTSPHSEQQRKSLSSQETGGSVKRTTPTLDIFGQSRSAAAHELEEYMESNNDKETKDRKTPASRSHTPESKRGPGSPHKTPEKYRVKYAVEDKKSKTGRKTPTDSPERKSPLGKKSSEKRTPSTAKESSLLDFLMEDNKTEKPKPQARGRQSKGMEHTDFLDDIFGNTQKRTSNEERTSPGAVGKKTLGQTGRKTPEHARKSPVTGDKEENIFQTIGKVEQTEDTSSICEDIPPDPNRKLANQGNRSTNQTTEGARLDDAIETVAVTQMLKYTAPAKKMRPRTASAKVQHRPKPRYGDQLDKTSSVLQERQFNSTGDIRDAIYEEWYKEHIHSARQKKKDEEKKAKEEEEKKKKEAEDKRQEAELSYKAWMEQKKKKLQEDHKEEKKEKLAKEKLEQEKKEQKDKSKKVFETWKGRKDAIIKTELQRKHDEAKEVERQKKQELLEKQKDREKAHKTWMSKKDQQLLIQIKQKKKEEKNKRSFEEESKEELSKKEKSAEEIYHEWIEKKENQARLQKVKARRKSEDEEGKPAWSPASRTIPFGR